MMRFNSLIATFGLITSLTLGLPCRAALIEVDILDAVMTAGTTGYIDVVIRGMGAPITGFDYRITISAVDPNGAGNVVFSTQDLQDTNLPDYVFHGLDTSPTPKFAANNEVTGGDFRNVGESVVNGEFILARLNVEHQGGLAEFRSEADFTVSFSDAIFIYSVFDEDLGEALVPYAPGDVTLGSGTLKIVATPEPATLGALGIACIFVVRGVKRRLSKTKIV